MGIDYTVSALWGVEIEVPPGEEDPEGWLEELLAGTEFSYFVAGSSYSGDLYYAIGIGACTTSRGGSAWERFEEPTNGQQFQFREFLKSKGIRSEPSWMRGQHVW